MASDVERPGAIGRRDLLRAAAAAGVAGAAGGAARAQANSRIGLGFIGVGGRGSWLFNDFIRRTADPAAGLDIVAVCDVWDRRAQDMARAAGGKPKVFRDYREVLAMKGVDAVVVATPDHWHSKITIEAMKSGRDVYCEKPLTLYWEQAKEVARVSRETEKIVQCGAGSGSDGAWWTARDVIKQGGIGPVIWTQGGAFRNDPSGDWNWGIQPCKPGVDLDWDLWLGWKYGLAAKRPYDAERYSRFRKYWDYSGGLATDLLYHTYAHLAIALDHELPTRVVAAGGQPVHNLTNDHREVPTLFTVTTDYASQRQCLLVGTQECEEGVAELVRGQKAVLSTGGPGVIVRPQAPFRDEMMSLARSLDCYRGAELVTHKEGDRTILDEIRVASKYNWDHIGNWVDCLRSRQQPTLNADRAYRVMVPIALSVLSYRSGRAMLFDPEKQELTRRIPASV
ncbi:MAG: Gfo/Idh/MocA family oxidoreductase [Armatimonadetes bacterium]|nr:Gfo/Idh/MocA family oxidoreductase [Armatimonadota bacterium]